MSNSPFNKYTWGKGQQYLEDLLNANSSNGYKDLKLLSIDNPYLFEISYDSIDYDYANSYFKQDNAPIQGGCSGCRSGNYVGRNFDWYYDNSADFIIKVPRVDDRFASIGMAAKTTAGLDYKTVRSKKYNDLYRILPFYTLDGINEFGLYCQTNVVPVADNPVPTTITGQEGQPEISMKMVCRYVLDHFKTAQEATQALKNDLRIFTSKDYTSFGFEAHWLICDAEDSFVVEIVNNGVIINECNIMTNFYISNTVRNSDGSYYSIRDNTASSCPAISTNHLSNYADGIERFNILNTGQEDINSVDDMLVLMKSINYTNAYDIESEDFWYSDFLGKSNGLDVTVQWTKEQFQPYLPLIAQQYAERNRNTSNTWQTVHTSVYDLVDKKMYIQSQENKLEDKTYEVEMEIK